MKFYFFNKSFLQKPCLLCQLRQKRACGCLHLFLTDEGHTPVAVLLIYPFLEDSSARVILADFAFALQMQCLVQPVCNAGKTGVFVDLYAEGAVQQLCCIEDVINFLILRNAVCVNTGSGYIKVTPDEGGARGDFIAKLFFIKFCDFL